MPQPDAAGATAADGNMRRTASVIIYGREDSDATRELMAACRHRAIAFESRPLEPTQPAPHRREALAKLRAAGMLETSTKAGNVSASSSAPTSTGLQIEIPLVDVEGELFQAPSVETIQNSIRLRGFAEPAHAAGSAGGLPASSHGSTDSSSRLIVYTLGPAEAEPWTAALVRQLRAAGLSLELRDTLGSNAPAVAHRDEMWALAKVAPWWRGGAVPLAFPLVHAYGGPLLQRPSVEAVVRARQAAGLPPALPPKPQAGMARLVLFSRMADPQARRAAERLVAELEGASLGFSLLDIDESAEAARQLWAAVDAAQPARGAAAPASGAANHEGGGGGSGPLRLPVADAYGSLLFAPSLADVRRARQAAGLPEAASGEELFGAAELSAAAPGTAADGAAAGLAEAGRFAPGPPLLSVGAGSAGVAASAGARMAVGEALAPIGASVAAGGSALAKPWLERALSQHVPAILARCAALGRQFEDPDFPAGPAALFREPNRPPRGHSASGVVWLRPRQIHAGAALFPAPPAAEMLVQGALADGWLLSAFAVLAAAAAPPAAATAAAGGVGIENVFASYDAEAGVFSLRLHVDGAWRTVAADDRVPCDARTRAPLYARGSRADAAWVPLLEKGIAKLLGSYEALAGGSVGYGLRLLTGGMQRELPLPAAAAKAAGGGHAPTSAAAAELARAVGDALRRGALVAAVPGGATSSRVPGGFGGLRTVDGGLWRGRAYAVVAVAGGGGAGAAGAASGVPAAGGSGAWLRFENRFAREQRADGAWQGQGGWLAEAPAAPGAGAGVPSADGVSVPSADGVSVPSADGVSSFWIPAAEALRLVSTFKECVLVPPQRYGRALATGSWQRGSAGGGPHVSSFPTNPHFLLSVPEDASVLIQLHAPDARLEAARAPPHARVGSALGGSGSAAAAGVGGGAGWPAAGIAPAIGFVLAEATAAEVAAQRQPAAAGAYRDGYGYGYGPLSYGRPGGVGRADAIGGGAGDAGAGGVEGGEGRLIDLSRRTRLALGLRWARSCAVGELVPLSAGKAYVLVPCTLAPAVIAPFCVCAYATAIANGSPLQPTLEALPPLASEWAAEELIAAYRQDLAHPLALAAAASGPAAARAVASPLAPESPFSADAEAIEWDARLPAADPRLPADARLAVQLRVLRAHGLPPKDDSPQTRAALRAGQTPPAGPSALASPYCIVTLDDLHRRQRGRTRTVVGTCAPAWDEAFTFEGASADARLVVDVYDADPFGDDDFLGKATLLLSELPRDGSASERAVRLIEGSLELGITVWP